MNIDQTTSSQPNLGPHLSDETLSELTSGALSDRARLDASRHLEACPSCTLAVRDYTVLKQLLSALPEPKPSRTFQLTEEQARIGTKRRWWTIPSFMPALPTLRAATVAVALLLIAVASADRLTQPNDNSSNTSHLSALTVPAIPAATATTARAAAAKLAPTQSALTTSEQTNAGQPVAPGAESTSKGSVSDVGAAAPAAAAPQSGSSDSAAGGASSASFLAPTATATASPETVATPLPSIATPAGTPSATPGTIGATTNASDSSRTNWRIAELGLGFLLLWLLVGYVGAWQTSRKHE